MEVKPEFFKSCSDLMLYFILHKPFIVSSPLIDYPVGGGMFSVVSFTQDLCIWIEYIGGIKLVFTQTAPLVVLTLLRNCQPD